MPPTARMPSATAGSTTPDSAMVPLRVRSHFSLMHGTSAPDTLCRRAAAMGYSRLALTDIDNLYGLWPFLTACENHRIKPIIGAELSTTGNTPLTALVQDSVGYRNLCRLITRRRATPAAPLPLTDETAWQGLFVLTGDQTHLESLYECGVAVAADLGNRPSRVGTALRKGAGELGIAAVATPNSSLAGSDEAPLYRLLQAIRTNSLLSHAPPHVPDTTQPAPLLAPEVYRERFAVWPEVVRATDAIAERCTLRRPDFGMVMPPCNTPAGSSAARVIRDAAYRGARRRYGDDLSETVVERLEHELRIIEQMGFSAYFLVVRDIIHPLMADGTRRRRRICGRGSAAASLVAYCLEITNVCPIRYNLYFERFLNPGRRDPPDIDIDFAWDERDDVLAEVFTAYPDRAAMVCNQICFQPRMAIRETARAFGLPDYEISRVSRRLPWFHLSEQAPLAERLSRAPTLKNQDFSGPWPEIIALAEQLVGAPRHLSVHPGGVVITPAPLSDYVPVERAAKGVPIIQWEKDATELAGLVKIDLLGNRSLAVVRDAIGAVRAGGEEFSEQNWEPEDDPATRAAVAQGATMGCFYIESPAMRLLQQKGASGDFAQLVIQSSIIRPAANEFVREYVRRLHGGIWHPLHPGLEEVLDETFGLMVYQEDVSKVAVALAGFSHSEADGLRKVMSKKDREHHLGDYRSAFFTGCRDNGMSDEAVEPIWNMMMSFAGYSFCKPHSASYARVSFQAAYLKVHRPAEFMAAVISNQGGYYSTFAYVSEAKRLGLTIEPPDVTISNYRWHGKGSRLRVGLQAIRDLSGETVRRLLAARANEPFASFDDLCQRVHPAVDELTALLDSGALDAFTATDGRAALAWQIAVRRQKRRGPTKTSLFAEQPVTPPPLPEQPEIERLRKEYRTLGFLTKQHPIELLSLAYPRAFKAVDLARHVHKRVRFAGWLLTGKLVSTRTGDPMEFLSFEDETGIIEATLFPRVYRQHAHLLGSGRPYLLGGTVEEDFGAITLTVKTIKPLHSTPAC
jgi:DNA-directed DNA polymerase III PolC